MSGHVSDPGFPRPVLLAIGGMLAALVIGAGMVRYTGHTTGVPDSTPVVTRDLRFEDMDDLGVAVRDASTGALVATLHGEQGFLRATVRGLAQQRRREETPSQAPFRLTAWADGRLTLDDPVTNRHVELEAFGQTNEDVFLQFLPGREAK